MARIALIGAGSVTFTRRVLSDLFSYPELTGLTVALHDIDAGRLATAEAMAKWMADRLGTDARVEACPERRRAIAGADYVINVIAVGGHAAAKLDFEVPARFGIRQTIADTLGIGGIFRALRTIPVARAIGNELAELSPRALLLNYTNPMTMIPRAVYEGSPFTQVVGLCHSVRDTEGRLARLAGVPREECAMVTAGVNHQAFVLRFTRDGEDLYPLLDRAIAADPELSRTVRVEMYRRLGFFPTESSEHGSEYVPWFLPHDEQIEQFRIPIGEYLTWLDRDAGVYDEHVRGLASGVGVPIEPSSELVSEVIHSIETGTPRVVYGNIRNDGLIGNLPPQACVEVPCFVDRAGMRPMPVGALPPQLAALNSNFLNVGELTLRAVFEEQRSHVYHAAMLDPHTAARLPLDRITALVDAMIEAHNDLLPPFLQRPSMSTMAPSEGAASAHPLYNLPLREWRPETQLQVPASAEVTSPRRPVIDAHSHLGRWLTGDGSWMVADPGALVGLMDRCGVRAMVNLDGRWGDELAANIARYDNAYPGRFATFCHVDWDELATPGFGERIARGLAASVAAGARGLKVWKDLGLHRRDHSGELILLDDPRLAPLWAEAAAQRIPIAVHTADPRAFFEPIDERNERLEQLLHYPQWSFAGPEFPPFERLIDALETVVAAHPGTTFIGVHGGCYPEDLTRVGAMLDAYPNYHIDISARLAELGRQPRTTHDLFTRHPDRVLFGTDSFPPDERVYRLHYRFLETRDEQFPHDPDGDLLMGRWAIDGLGLDDATLGALYAGNAARLVPSLGLTG
ncbi:alpha-galactosidase [Dactylosporangium sp. NPDC051541]|uniref:alpha-galactosidase n=1 Tax=Dactylosporangium sp. NPDC051541 TaxID=3363977 RepID=UPI0037A999F2